MAELNPKLGEYIHDALDRIEHTSTVDVFFHRFTAIHCLLVKVQPWLPEAYFATRFIYGLRPEYQVFVLSFNPVNIFAAHCLAMIFEESIEESDFEEQSVHYSENISTGNILGGNLEEVMTEKLPYVTSVCEDIVSGDKFPELSTAIGNPWDAIGEECATIHHNLEISEAMKVATDHGEESVGTSPCPTITDSNALGLCFIIEPKEHPPDGVIHVVDTSLSSGVYVFRQDNVGNSQLHRIEVVMVPKAIQASSSHLQIHRLTMKVNYVVGLAGSSMENQQYAVRRNRKGRDDGIAIWGIWVVPYKFARLFTQFEHVSGCQLNCKQVWSVVKGSLYAVWNLYVEFTLFDPGIIYTMMGMLTSIFAAKPSNPKFARSVNTSDAVAGPRHDILDSDLLVES